ncbi:MAG TPA: hypothetical protein ENF18_08580 [candidate division WOR-3 bacterium]|uniref:Uncharacterized protein n=1 Tax=candidate division WOR-3 bacterium TaxID=2052148 RepID=A0A7C0VBJ0_UNCW3|nr:hypothetical protein [candidate division WOR-3 bacterium]
MVYGDEEKYIGEETPLRPSSDENGSKPTADKPGNETDKPSATPLKPLDSYKKPNDKGEKK